MRTDPTVRRATSDDVVAVTRVLEGALLEVDAGRVSDATASGEALVATVDGRVVGALVRDGSHVSAVAVTPARRGQGVGRALVERAAASVEGRLSADFEGRVRGFYESLGFDVHEREDGRFVGRSPPGG